MTIPSIPNTDRIADYTATAAQTDFVVPWIVIADSTALAVNDIVAEVDGVAVTPALTTFAGSAITGVSGMWNGGTLTIPICQGGERVVIYSARSARRTGHFLEGSGLPFSELDKLQDDIVVMLRDLSLKVGRSLKVSVEDYLDGFHTDDILASIQTNADQAEAAAVNAIGASAAVAGALVYATPWVASVKTAPTGAEAAGTRYLVASVGATGAFLGKGDNVAELVGGVWTFATPGDGQQIFVQNEYTAYRYKNAAWSKSCTIVSSGDTLATALASGASAFIFMPGTYTSVGITIPSNCTITAIGKVVLQTTSLATPIWDFTNAVNVLVRGNFKLQGNGSNNTGNPPAGATNSGQNAIKLYNSVGVDIDGYIEICNIKGYAVDDQAPASSFAIPGLNSIRGLRVHDCYFGAYVRNFAEYSKYSDCWFYNNICGVKDESGNRGYHNCFMVFNQFGFFLDGTAEPSNNAHGIVSGCFINHNTTNITCDTATLGMLFTGCQIISEPGGSGHGVVNIINGSKLIQFTGCGFGSNVLIDATSEVNFVGNTIRSTLSNAPSVAAGGICRGEGNIDENGAQASLWNGMSSLTPTVSFGGASVGITYVDQEGRVKYDSGYLDFTMEIVLGSKGSSTGLVSISGLPAVAGPVPANIPVTVYATGMNAAVTDLKGFVAATTGTIKLFNFNAGSITQLTDTAFTGTDTIYISGRIPLG